MFDLIDHLIRDRAAARHAAQKFRNAVHGFGAAVGKQEDGGFVSVSQIQLPF